ncbi:methyl-CpG-binding domain protein 4-like protein [Selaginella moellendorffii]|uniref:methyl-CpG-binding domain protein 4-like protein n=1 Tax=Selaginella moellendorffii TaxID=88036 RepID=UPI000D1CD48D|nr:methyl-CpG-binding domain protein 4-like protein [Selaginella moellendorffii]|eukprot:XP_002992263.2 methyl-CpG-binding domain protein 4-like protein [Selaginella moellendorffii]
MNGAPQRGNVEARVIDPGALAMGKRRNSDEDSSWSSSSSSSSSLCGACSSRRLRAIELPAPPIHREEGKDRPVPALDARKFTEMLAQFVHTSKRQDDPAPRKEMSILERKIQQAELLGKATSRSSKKMRRTWNKEEQCYYITTPYFPKPDFSKKARKNKRPSSPWIAHEGKSHREIIASIQQTSWRVADKFRVEEKKAEFEKRKRRLRKNLSLLECPRTNFPLPAWIPPRSPHKLIQEKLFHDPWKVVMACIFLHRTTGAQTKKMLWDFFKLFPGPQHLIDAPAEMVEPLIKPLGLHKKRLELIKRFSHEYLYTDWTDISQLHGVGTYAEDAYMIFVEGRWKEVIPDDAMLEQYWNWLHVNSEEKTGLC